MLHSTFRHPCLGGHEPEGDGFEAPLGGERQCGASDPVFWWHLVHDTIVS